LDASNTNKTRYSADYLHLIPAWRASIRSNFPEGSGEALRASVFAAEHAGESAAAIAKGKSGLHDALPGIGLGKFEEEDARRHHR
jgi:hypothetical protein